MEAGQNGWGLAGPSGTPAACSTLRPQGAEIRRSCTADGLKMRTGPTGLQPSPACRSSARCAEHSAAEAVCVSTPTRVWLQFGRPSRPEPRHPPGTTRTCFTCQTGSATSRSEGLVRLPCAHRISPSSIAFRRRPCTTRCPWPERRSNRDVLCFRRGGDGIVPDCARVLREICAGRGPQLP